MLDLQSYIWTPSITVNQIDETTSVFEVKYLPRWLGHTFWNSLRRIVLGYAFGGSITALKIKWVAHEYTVIEWVKESAMDILLNFKKLRFKVDESLPRTQRVSLKLKWVGVYGAWHLDLPTWVESLTPEQYLFEITDPNCEVYLEYRVEKWYGYMSIEQLRIREEKSEETDVNLLLIDNDFSLVRAFAYEVEEAIDDFIGTTKDVIKFTMTTISPLIDPKDIMSFSAEVLCSYGRLFLSPEAYVDRSFFVDYAPEVVQYSESSDYQATPARIQPIEILWLSERTRNALLKNNILFVEDLEKKKKSELISMRWVWKKAVDEIEDALRTIGKSLIY